LPVPGLPFPARPAGHGSPACCHPKPAAEQARVQALAGELGLAATGGSDDHGALTGYRIGSQTTPAESWERLAAQASGAPAG